MPKLGDGLVRHCDAARSELLLVAPFVKELTIERLLRNTSSQTLRCITRWKPVEVAAGVSDLDVYLVLRDRGGTLWLRNDLHAKYYRADDIALVGSANLTATALGWTDSPNLELLSALSANDPVATTFERELDRHLVPVTDDVYEAFCIAQAEWTAALPTPPAEVPLASVGNLALDPNSWLPQTRQPQDLYRAYMSEDPDELPSALKSRAATDLAILATPHGLTEPAFNATAAASLLTTAIHHGIDDFVATPQRFGAVRDFLAQKHGLDRTEASEAWQTIIRWLQFFLPDRYDYSRPGHSEIISRR